MDLYLTNSLTKKKEKFDAINPSSIGVYSCGPTVYWNQHIGHMYAYVQWDILVRFLRSIGYEVKWVMNVTDVGHMTSDEDTGEDKMEKGAKREGLSVWDVAKKYIAQFTDSLELLNIKKPDVISRATEHIDEQIELIKKIEQKGFTYKTKMGIVFDTSKFPDYAKFANLKLEEMRSRSDVAVDPEKKNPWDFFLWVIDKNHAMQWDSPWGKGYPGWHIECTAMSTKYLGNNFDIHTGGVDHLNVHHTNEIAQGYAAFGKQTANYWLHNAHLLGEGGVKMSKSLGNFLTTQELVEKGYDPLALRYLILTSHYKKGLNFSFDSLDAAQTALGNLRSQVGGLRQGGRSTLSSEKLSQVEEYRDKFTAALSNDLNVSEGLAVLWEMLKSSIPNEDKYDLAVSFDEVLGLKLAGTPSKKEIPDEIKKLILERDELRKEGKFDEADKIRDKIIKLGFEVKDRSL
jgi:cysteinyl-tRNA synthetase